MTSFRSLFSYKSNLSRTDSATSASSTSTGGSSSIASTSTVSSPGTSGRKQLRSLTRNLFNDLVHFELQSLRKRRSTSLSHSSAAPRRTLSEMIATGSPSFSAAAKPSEQAPERGLLVDLMHAERQTSLTREYRKYIGTRFESVVESMGDGTKLPTKGPRTGPKLAKVDLSAEAREAERARSKQISLAVKQLDELVTSSRKTYSRDIANGIVPPQALKGTVGLSKDDFLDIIIKFQKKQDTRHDDLIDLAETSLRKLLPANSTEEAAAQFLEGFVSGVSRKSNKLKTKQAPGTSETPQQALQRAVAGLPERRLMDIADRYGDLLKERLDKRVISAASDLNVLLPRATREEAQHFLQDLMKSSAPVPLEEPADEYDDLEDASELTLLRTMASLPSDRLEAVVDRYMRIGHDMLVEEASADLMELLGDVTAETAKQFLQNIMHTSGTARAEASDSEEITPEEDAEQALRRAMADLPEDRHADVVQGYLALRQEQHNVLVDDIGVGLMNVLHNASIEETEQFLQRLMTGSDTALPDESGSGEIEPNANAEHVLRQALARLPENRLADVVEAYAEASRLARFDAENEAFSDLETDERE